MKVNTLFGLEESETFKCIHCKKIKPLNEMGVDKAHKVRFECISCRKKNSKVVSKLKKEYGHLKPSLKDSCPICGRTGEQILEEGSFNGQRGPWTLDHDHKTKKFRDYICQHCNNGLSGFKDKIKTLEKAIEYLKK